MSPASARHCVSCGAALSPENADRFPSGTSTTVGPSFFVRRGAAFGTDNDGYARRLRIPFSLLLPMFLVIGLGWVIWDAPIPLPDSRPIIALNKMAKTMQSRKHQELHANAADMAAPRLQAATSPTTAAHLSAVSAITKTNQSRPATGLQKEKVLPAEAPSEQEEIQADIVHRNDRETAALSLKEAVAKGDHDAPVNLANMYLKGEGVPHSCEQALALLQTAASKPNVRARNRLAAVYATGICVQRDRVQAYRWLALSLAVDPNNVWAQQNRALTWREMTPEERSVAEANP